MKKTTALMIVFLFLIFVITQCTKKPTEPEGIVDSMNETEETVSEITDEALNEINSLDAEIQQLDEEILTDISQDAIPRRLQIALDKLERMLNRVRTVVMVSEIEEAITLYREARAAQNMAIHALDNGHYKRSFGFIRESRFLAIEAIRIVKGETTPEELKEAALEHLIEKKREVQALLDELTALLEEQENDRAQKLVDRAVLHIDLATEAIDAKELKRARFHLKKAEDFAQRALKILNPPE